jgi:hypothetical protein
VALNIFEPVVAKLPVSASVINEPVCPPNVFHLESFEEVYELKVDDDRKGVTTANDEVVANPKLVIWFDEVINDGEF